MGLSVSTPVRCTAIALALATLSLGASAPLAAQEAREEWVVPERRARAKNPVKADAASVARGRELYKKECQKCHGATGQNDGSEAKEKEASAMAKARKFDNPEVGQQTDGALFYKITEGKKPMPSMVDVLPERDRWMLVNYIRTLMTPVAPAGSTDPPRSP
jgi:mono/diheme cytochrome c family protein